ncbi:hypothetical protein ACFL2W_00035, partial [Candidatus Omnitrophota bacterium]
VFLQPFLKTKNVSSPSRLAGALVGAAKGIFFAILVLVSLHVFAGFLKKINPSIETYLRDSYFCVKLREGVELFGVDAVDKLYYANKLLSEDLDVKKVNDEEVLLELRENPSIKAILQDKQLMKKIQDKQYREVLTDPKFSSLLKDKEFIKMMYSIDYEALYKRITSQEQE